MQKVKPALLRGFDQEYLPQDQLQFNRLIDMEYDRIRDFLILHYHATQRRGMPFWDYVRTMEIPDTLADKMELFRRRGRVVKYREGVFLDASWIAVYLGQGVIPEGHDARADLPPVEAVAEGMRRLHAQIRGTVERMPDHREHLNRYCPMAKVA